ncbi:MAG: ankyrin repeat domain-containing protein [Legionella sp.]|nr:ankyrin repeat domain-containing protein [Legionella sp.]
MSKKLTHADLLTLGQALGYKLEIYGLCRGFAGMLNQAVLAEDQNTFFNRLQFIESYNKDFKKLNNDIEEARHYAKGKIFATLDDETKTLLEIPAFYEGIELYLAPGFHVDLFATNAILQGNIQEIYFFVRSQKLEQENKEISIALNKSYAFDKQSLIAYIKDLEQVLDGQGVAAPIMLSNSNHTVNLRYDTKNKKWQYTDTNDFACHPKNTSYSRELDSELLTESIFYSFCCKQHAYTVFNTQILIEKKQQKSLQNALDKFNEKYPIKPELVTMYDDYKTSLLYIACQNGQLEMVRELLKQQDININHANNNRLTPLYIACQNRYVEVVHELLKQQGINVNQANNNDVTPLYTSCRNGHVEMVRELLKHGNIHINQADNKGITPLYAACHNGHYEVVLELLKQEGIDINQADNEGITPLYAACRNGHYEVVRELLKHEGIGINQANSKGATPLHIACRKGHTRIAAILMDSKHIDSINSLDSKKNTPLHIACRSNHTYGKKELFEALLNKGASLSLKNKFGKSASDCAIKKKNTSAIEVINSFQSNFDEENVLESTKNFPLEDARFFNKKHPIAQQNNHEMIVINQA